MRAFDVFETLNCNIRKTLGHDKEALAAAMSAFDFVRAAQVCAILIENANEAAAST
jgi:hypothetical protein